MKIISSTLAPPLSASVCLSDANAECAHSGIEKMCNLRCLAGGVAAGGEVGLHLALISVSCWNSLTAFHAFKCSYPCRQHARQSPLSFSLLLLLIHLCPVIMPHYATTTDGRQMTDIGDIALRDLLMSL